jgi:adenosylcobinamide-phosphate synthase
VVGRAGQAAVGIVADLLLGEPKIGPHPVAVFGKSMRAIETRTYADDRSAGIRYAAAGVCLGAGVGAAVRSTALATYVSVAGRGLREAAEAVATALTSGDVEAARGLLPSLVGRDPTGLDVKEICRAVVESVAENTVDAVVAPALWAAAAGAPGTLGYRAVNTLDALVGHHSPRYEHFGQPSARLDDAANWIPARVTAGLVILARPARARTVLDVVRRDAPAHPSPNAGVAEAAFAAALGLRLGGTNRYGDRLELRPHLGDGRPAEPEDIARAVRLSRDVSLVLAAALCCIEAVAR